MALARTLAALLAVPLVVACADPYGDGKALGQAHVALVRAHELTYQRLSRELDAGTDAIDDDVARKKFRDGYTDAIEPVKREIALLLVEGAAEEAGEAAGHLMGAFGRAVEGFANTVDAKSSPARDEKLKRLGRSVGKAVRGLGDDLETIAEGVEEGLEEPRK